MHPIHDFRDFLEIAYLELDQKITKIISRMIFGIFQKFQNRAKEQFPLSFQLK